uniref:Putative dual specificity protein kinase spla n=1 Tax=Lutzomyia longipalpis TaxID=7200 RepID=A0A1B0CSL0_LUTLO
MSVIIRLQNLPWSANALDIRAFFKGLSILDGGVNIVGGEMGDAFIAFSTDEDARQALMMTGGKIKEVGVQLFLSSRAEMQKVIETARQQTTAAFAQVAPTPPPPVITPIAPVVTTIVAATPVIETPPVVATPIGAAAAIASPLSNLLTRQMLEQKFQQQEQEKLQQQLEQQLLEHKKALLQQQLEKQGGFNMELGKSILMGEQFTQQLSLQQQQQLLQQRFQQQGGQEKPLPQLMQQHVRDPRRSIEKNDKLGGLSDRDKDRDRRGRDRKSRSRSRDRRRSRSRDRSSRRRRERSRSRDRRDRDRDRRRRDRRTNSRERSHDRDRSSKESDRERNKDRPRDEGGAKDLALKGNQGVFASGIWDIPPNIQNTTTQPLTLQPTVDISNAASASSLSPEERTNLLKLSEKRDLNAFQGGNSWNNSAGYSTGNSNASSRGSGQMDTGLCVRISGMELITGYGEIRRFFQGLAINSSGIKMINDTNGKRIGEACVEFIRPDYRRYALMRDGMMLKEKKVHVVAITQEEFDKEIDSYRPLFMQRGRNNQEPFEVEDDNSREKVQSDADEPTRCLKMTNLPAYATQQDIKKMYANFSIDEIVLVQENSRVCTAYVRFFRSNDAKMAFNLPSGSLLYRNLDISLCEEEKFNRMMMYHAGGIRDSVRSEREERTDGDRYDRGHYGGRQYSTEDRGGQFDSHRDRGNYDGQRDRKQYDSDGRSSDGQQQHSRSQFRARGRSRFDNPDRKQFESKQYESHTIEDNDESKCERADEGNKENSDSESAYNPEQDITNTTAVGSERKDNKGEAEKQNDSVESENVLQIDEDSHNEEVYKIDDDDCIPAEVEVSMDIVSQESNEECTNVFKKHEDPRLSRGTLNDSIQLSFNQSSLDPRLNRAAAQENRDPRLGIGRKLIITDRDVVDFFSDVGLIPLRVHMLLNTVGQPSGDCFVEFSNPEDAEKALVKNRQHLGQNTVTVETIAREKVEEILNSFDEPSPAFEVDSPDDMTPPPPTPPFGMRSGSFGMQQPPNLMRMRGPFPPRLMGPNGPAGPMGPPFGGVRPPFGAIRMNGNGMMNLMPKGCIVAAENLPYRATYDDILEFFRGFDLTPTDIMRRFNDKGQATGDARIRFVNPGEAMRAVETRNQMRMMGRPVYLNLLDN